MNQTDDATHLEHVMSFETPCDANEEWHFLHGTGAAEWIVIIDICCPKNDSHLRLLCTGCKDAALNAKKFQCVHCGTVWKPASTYIRSIQPLK